MKNGGKNGDNPHCDNPPVWGLALGLLIKNHIAYRSLFWLSDSNSAGSIYPQRVCIKTCLVDSYVFKGVVADLRSPTSLKDVLLVCKENARKCIGELAWKRMKWATQKTELLFSVC